MDLFKMLSDETRLRIIILLSKEELCVCELCGILGSSQPIVSRNLSKLKAAGIVIDHRREKFVFYKLEKNLFLLENILKPVIDSLAYNHKYIRDLERLENKVSYMFCNDQMAANSKNLNQKDDTKA